MIKPKEEIFKYYFYFVQERMNIFWNKYDRVRPWTTDEILKVHKFTNVYRAMDRVSQYLIRNVIYSENSFSDEDVLLRILVFKIFNKPDTWEYLEDRVGTITVNNFELDRINRALLELKQVQPIFNNAYMMTGTHSLYNHLNYKHEKWLDMVKKEIVGNSTLRRIIDSNSLSEVFELLRDCSFIGDFLAYQYAIDMNYSDVIDFDENSFVKAGIGAIRGIKKCFEPLDKKYSYEDAIKYTHDHFDYFLEKFDCEGFKPLFDRGPMLIDLQNCFCETDKYLRVKVPELQVDNKRIKQKYKETNKSIELFFPPKWNINSKITRPCIQPSMKESTLF
ncbi:hypothetical protein EYV94_26000 [Puteibacter caeruleilacunae]|nr:hypothetical protein EYV94_26000 [Puteibacter caeruleilacunae]